MGERSHRVLNESGTVINLNQFHARGQAWLNLGDFCLHSVNHLQGIFARTHHHDTANHFTFAIQIDHATTQLSTDLNMGNVFEQERRFVRRHHTQGQSFKVRQLGYIPFDRHAIFRLALLNHRGTQRHRTLLQSGLHLAKRNAITAQ